MRFAITATLASATLILLACWVLDVAENTGASLLPQIRARIEAVSRLRFDRDEYAKRLEATIADVDAGRISLREAAAELEAYAAEHYPALFKHLENLDFGTSQRQQVAKMLLRHCDGQAFGQERRAQLVSEYESWLAE